MSRRLTIDCRQRTEVSSDSSHMYAQGHTQGRTVGGGSRRVDAGTDGTDSVMPPAAKRRGRAILQVALEELDRRVDVPLHRQLFDRLRDAIVSGRMPAGSRLPSTRALNTGLGISRNTAIEALAQLAAEGYVTSVRGSGTFVAAAPETAVVNRREVRPAQPESASTGLRRRALGVSRRGDTLHNAGERLRAWLPAVMRPFDLGPGASEFPARAWRAALVATDEAARGRWPRPGGEPELRHALAEHLRVTRGMSVSSEQVFLVRGPHNALDFATRLVTDVSDTALVENPGSLRAHAVMEGNGLLVVPVDVDADGFSVAMARELRMRPRVILVRPSSQFPLGLTMSMRRRRELLGLAEELMAWLIEDDRDSAYRFEGAPYPSLQGLDASGHVIQIGTLSDVLFPSVELAYLVVPPPLIRSAAAGMLTSDVPATVGVQLALAALIESGHFERLIRRVRHANMVRRDALHEGLHPLPGPAALQEAQAGMHLLVWLEGDESGAVNAAASQGINVRPLSPLYARDARQGLLIGYAAFAPDDIRIRACQLRDILARGN